MIIRGFHEAGGTVYICSRNVDACQEVANTLDGRAVALAGDISTQQGCQQLARKLSTQHTTELHVLVNNAGAIWEPQGTPLEDYPDAAWDIILDTNVRAPFHLTVACLPMLRKAATARRPARVINIGSQDGIRVPRLETYAYSASKAAVQQLTRHLAGRLAAEHITVNAILPGLFPSQMTAFALDNNADEVIQAIPLRRAGQQDDITGAAIYLSSAAGAWVTGVLLSVDGGSSMW